jgi:hypothetical protein
MKAKKKPRLDIYIIHEDTECTYGKCNETRFLAFNPHDKSVEHKEDWPGIGFESKKAVDGVIKRLQAIAASFE